MTPKTSHDVASLRPLEYEKLTLSIAEAAQMIGISRPYAYELASRGELPIVRIGGRILVSRRRLIEMIDGSAAD